MIIYSWLPRLSWYLFSDSELFSNILLFLNIFFEYILWIILQNILGNNSREASETLEQLSVSCCRFHTARSFMSGFTHARRVFHRTRGHTLKKRTIFGLSCAWESALRSVKGAKLPKRVWSGPSKIEPSKRAWFSPLAGRLKVGWRVKRASRSVRICA